MSIFQKSVIKTYLAGIDKDQAERAYEIFQKNYSAEKTEKIKKLKEEEYQDGFLRDIFADVLGYTLKPNDNFNLVREFKNPSDGRKADAAILKNDKAAAVIELKSTKTKDLKIIAEQAFSYKNNQPACKYVITSNFQKLRFYIDYANEYEEFDLFRLKKEDFDLLFLILCKESILNDTPEKLKKESVFHEESVSKQLYADYSVFRKKLFENLTANNPDIDKLTLFGKSQKLIDRFLFILFAEDKGLLPPNSINRIIERFHTLKEEDAYKPLYEIYKQYFAYMNTGRKGKRAADDIPAYNGGLFYPDEILYNLKIDDDILIDDLQKLSAYDFDTEVDVNILGHIFEHSLSEIEETTARIKGTDIDKSKSRRKKDGIFYTPQYITQYIAENTIGRICDEKRRDLDINEIEVDDSYYTKKGKLSKKGNLFYQKTEDYKNWLLSLKILDPACGSGAFLNQALTFLIREHHFVTDIQTELKKGQVSVFNIESAVLENNLYGVDINEESVEITKLSLWLRTAHKERKLSDLNKNIRCGNSLIDDPEIAGDRAFQWEKEFPEIMKNGGFDVVIGNPPYVRQELIQQYSAFLSKNYKSYSGKADLYVYFLEKGIKLLKNKGVMSFISSGKFFEAGYGKPLVEFIVKNSQIIEIIDFKDLEVFQGISAYPLILTVCKTVAADYNFNYQNAAELSFSDLSSVFNYLEFVKINNNDFIENNYQFVDNRYSNLIKKLNSGSKYLSDFNLLPSVGIKTGYNAGFETNLPVSDFVKNYVFGKDIKKYGHINSTSRIIFPYQLINREYQLIDIDNFEYLKMELEKHRDKLENRAIINTGIVNGNKKWFEYQQINRKLDFDKEYIVYPNVSLGNNFSLSACHILDMTSFVIPSNNKYFLAVLNSSITNFLMRIYAISRRGGYLEYKTQYLKQIPFKDISKKAQQPFIEKADIMLSKNREFDELKADFLNFFKSELKPEKISRKLEKWNALDWDQLKKEMENCKVKELSLKERKEWQDYFIEKKEKTDIIKSVIDSTDREIDQMVYELYGLTPEEIKIVEKTPAAN